ncbi:hypothetical protein [Meiothermus rufus]|uniref:hypothetical protein n=1 Tax=Meiothermus rufus TaxID=604332 RepID=UPI000684CEE0|nr:hypothetical protein [Meiothermus rufus]
MLRKLRDYWLGRYEGWSLSRKHADLAYLTPNTFPLELAEKYRGGMEALLRRYERQRGRMEERISRLQHEVKTLAEIVGADEKTPAIFTRSPYLRYGLLGLVFLGEGYFNKLALDALEFSQLEAYVLGLVATLAMFWTGHTSGNLFRQNRNPLGLVLLAVPVLMVMALSLLRYQFTVTHAQVQGIPAPPSWSLPTLLVLGLGLVAMTVLLGYFTPHEREELQRRLFLVQQRERVLRRRLAAFRLQTERLLAQRDAAYRQEANTYWRGFARAWPRFDPAPGFLGHIPPLPDLRPRPSRLEGGFEPGEQGEV